MQNTIDRHRLGKSAGPVARGDYLPLRRAVVMTGVFLLAVVTQGTVRPGYDALQQSISALSLGPQGWVQDVFFLLLGVSLLTTVPAWRRVLAGGVGATAYPLLTAFTGLSLMGAAWWPQDPAPGYDPEQLGHALPTGVGLIHLTMAAIGSISSIAALFVMASRFATLEDWKAWVSPTRAAAFATIGCVVIYAVWSVEPAGFAGTFERLVVVIPGAWGYAFITRLGRGVPFAVTSAR